MKRAFSVSIVLLALLIPSAAFSQQLHTGNIRGTITDDTGAPLPGVNVTVTSPSLIGSSTGTSDENGLYRIPACPPGTYTVTCELPGFNTMVRKDVVVRVGMTLKVDITMEPAALAEELTVVAPSPMVDVQSTKIHSTITAEVMRNLPLNRDLYSIMALAPGVTSSSRVIHGGTQISNMFNIDGINTTDPDLQDPGTRLEYEVMEEVEIVTGGLTAQIGHTSGSFINVVTKSGGNDFHGSAQTYYTSEGLNQVLFTDEQLKAFNISKPSFSLFGIENSATLGGPILKDKLWFFATGAYNYTKYVANFVPTTILGVKYEPYQPLQKHYSGFLKLTGRMTNNLRFFLMGNYRYRSYPHASNGPFNAADYTDVRTYPNYTFMGNLSWIISPNTMLDIKGGHYMNIINSTHQPGAADNFYYQDHGTGYNWGGRHREEKVLRWSYQANTLFTHFADDLLGGSHEIRAGAEIYYGVSDWFIWRENPIVWYFYNGSPWYYRERDGLDGPHPRYGDGRIVVQNLGGSDGKNRVKADNICLTAFIQDSFTIANRLTLNLGLRLDQWNGWVPGYDKGAGTPLAEAIGADTYLPSLGFNPFGAMAAPDTWNDVIDFTTLSPRLGLVYDLFGDGKTALKLSYSRYRQVIGNASWQAVSPYRQKWYNYYWWDLNENMELDAPPVDNYVPYGGSPAVMSEEYFRRLVDPEMSGPMNDEIVASVNHQLLSDLNVGIQYFWKKMSNMYNAVLYDPDTDRYWYTYEQAPDWWIPFTTTIPAYDDFPEQTVTMYFLSKDSPVQMKRLAQVPEGKKRYQALEFTFEKRMSHGWQLGGSVVVSKVMSNIHDSRGANWGWSSAFGNANWWVNRYGVYGTDHPLMIKLFGTANLPLGFLASFFYTYFDGTPWQRTVSVVPPQEWADANNAMSDSFGINAEVSGTRRNIETSNMDFRLEKEFVFADFGKLGLFADIYNLLGHSYVFPNLNPGGTWRPVDENTNQGTFTPSGTYKRVTSTRGVRTFKFSVRFTF
jgi:hypothetical protein